MAKPLPRKFFIKVNYSVFIMNAPEHFMENNFHPLPENVLVTNDLGHQPFDVQIYFITNKAEVELILPTAIDAMKPKSYLWLCYPKGGKKAKISTDVNRDSFWQISNNFGLRPVHQISIDEVWSGLRFRLDN